MWRRIQAAPYTGNPLNSLKAQPKHVSKSSNWCWMCFFIQCHFIYGLVHINEIVWWISQRKDM